MSNVGFSADQLSHYASMVLDYHIRGPQFEIGIQEKPLLSCYESNAKPFTGGKEAITVPLRFDRGAGGVDDGVTGFSSDDPVGFFTPTGGVRASYIWREHHIGYTLTETELKQQGILIGDEFGSAGKPKARALEVLSPILESANVAFTERYAETMNSIMWDDGTSDTSALHGHRAFIRDIPTIGSVGGLSAVTHTKWRNRARTAAFFGDASFDADWGGTKITSAVANGGALLQVMQKEFRLLRKYGGKPNKFYAGSDFIDAMETEIRANGSYSDIGFTAKQDGAVGEMMFKGVPVVFDPTLDDLGRAKFAYVWDSSKLWLSPLEGDWKRVRNPARPYNKFVVHKSLVCTGQIVCKQRDCSGVYEIN